MYNNISAKFANLPKFLISLIIINCLFGFLVLYSAGDNNLHPWALKQMANFSVFFIVMLGISFLNIRTIYHYSYLFYLIVLAMLVGVELFGHIAMGAKRWLNLGVIKIQPSEPAKLAIVLFLSRYFHDLPPRKISSIPHLIPAIIGAILPVLLIIKQPDLGTGIITLIVVACIFFAAGVRLWKFAIVLCIILLAMPLIWHNLHPYQKKRVEVFLNPELDPLGSGYNIIQSKIAIGSGGLLGKGLGEGTQSHLSFLPEHQTDFIFACLAEDMGFIGCLTLLVIYGLIIMLSLSISSSAKNTYSKLVAVGVTSLFFSHIFVNVGMVTGMLPVVGIPLPLISYGGTMMASILIGFGLVINVYLNKNVRI